MKKVYFLLVFLLLFLDAKPKPSELFKQIQESKSSLATTKQQKSIANKQLQKIALKIKKLNKEIEEYNKKLAKLNQFLSQENKKYQAAMAEINGIDNIVKNLDKDIKKKREEFAKKISIQLGGVIAQNRSSDRDEKSVVREEVLNRYKNYNQQEMLKLSRNIEQKNALRKNLLKRRDEIAKSINNVKAQRELYKKEKAKREQLLKKLAKEEKLYSKKLKEIFKREAVIRLTLAKLNLVKEESAKEAKRREQELKRRINQLKKLRLSSVKNKKSIKESSSTIDYTRNYQPSIKIYKYRGPKTIAPLRAAKLIKPFGTFIDPIYKIKSHSDSVTLVSKVGDNRVYNVLNGVVAFKDENSMMGKYVIVKHDNGLFTIYSHLSKFSPFIKVGYRVKKGAVLGKVRKKLRFEATKNGKLINPIRLINI